MGACLLALPLTACSSGPVAARAQPDQPTRQRASTVLPRATFPLKIGPTGRYLVDRRGAPFLIVGDSPQALIGNLTESDAESYFADRRAHGFNTVWINLLCNSYTACRDDGSTYDGITPFRVPGDLSTPNARYFQRADAMIRLAARSGLAVFLDPIETGGWLDVLLANGRKKAYEYGRYLGSRYKRFPNIVWMSGNDFQTWTHPSDDAVALAVARGIASVDRNHIQTVELNYRRSSSLDDPRWRGVIGLDAAYTYYPTYAEVSKEYRRARHLPIFMVEANYELEHDYTGPETLRRQEYWTLLSGAAGQLYGNKYIWQFLDSWGDQLWTSGVQQLGYATKLFAGRRWFDLVPDFRHRVVTAGYGTFTADGNVNASDYVTAALTRDRRLLIAYLPTSRTVAVDLSKLQGRIRARWYDPTRGTYVPAARVSLAPAGERRFAPPRPNGDGDGDWVLVLTSR